MRATIRLADKLFWEGGVGQDGVFGFKISAVGVVVQGFMNRGQGGRAVSPSLNSAGADNSSKEVAAATFFGVLGGEVFGVQFSVTQFGG
jgi:hypothetical protein